MNDDEKRIEEDNEYALECVAFVMALRKHVRNLQLDPACAERIGKAVTHYEKTIERPNVGCASSDGDWDAE